MALVKGDESYMGLCPPPKYPPSMHTIWHSISEASWVHITSNLRLCASSKKFLVPVTFAQVHNVNHRCWLSEATWCVCVCVSVCFREEKARLVFGKAFLHPRQDENIRLWQQEVPLPLVGLKVG